MFAQCLRISYDNQHHHSKREGEKCEGNLGVTAFHSSYFHLSDRRWRGRRGQKGWRSR